MNKYEWEIISDEEKEIKRKKKETDSEIQDLETKLNQLRNEKKEQIEKEKEYKIKRYKKKLEYIKKHKDVILPLLSHSRTSCSDKNPCNGYDGYGKYRCSKCYLMELINGEWPVPDIKFDINFD